MRIFKNKLFHRWANKIGLDNDLLKIAIEEIKQGLHDADLGGNLYKKRIGVKGRGKSSGVRTIVAYKREGKAFYIYGYAKNVQANVSKKELVALIKLAKVYFSYEDKQISELLTTKTIIEVL